MGSWTHRILVPATMSQFALFLSGTLLLCERFANSCFGAKAAHWIGARMMCSSDGMTGRPNRQRPNRRDLVARHRPTLAPGTQTWQPEGTWILWVSPAGCLTLGVLWQKLSQEKLGLQEFRCFRVP